MKAKDIVIGKKYKNSAFRDTVYLGAGYLPRFFEPMPDGKRPRR